LPAIMRLTGMAKTLARCAMPNWDRGMSATR
jgi:hypothetical protein